MIDDIIQNANTNSGYDVEAYKQKKKEQLQNAYKLIDDACEEMKNGNTQFLKEYLDIQSRFDKYTIRNALLVAKQLPNAMQLKDYKSWKESKINFKSDKPNKILILEPREAYINNSGKKITPYNAKEVIDVSETNTKPYIKSYDKKLVLQALLHDCSIKIEPVNSLDDNKMCSWNKETNTIYTCRTDDYDKAISSLAIEIAKANLYDETSEISNEKASYIGYMISKKYNIDCSIDEVPNVFANKETQDIKDELSSMKNVLDDVNSRMTQYLDDKVKEVKSKDMER